MMASTSTSQTQAQAIPQPELRQTDGQVPGETLIYEELSMLGVVQDSAHVLYHTVALLNRL